MPTYRGRGGRSGRARNHRVPSGVESRMSFRRITTLASIAVAATVGGGASVIAGTSAPASTEPTGGADLIASLTVQGLFPVSAPFLQNSPAISVYSDGTVLVPATDQETMEDTPPPLVTRYVSGTIAADIVDELITSAESTGLAAAAPDYAPNPQMADAPRTWLVVDGDAGPIVHTVDGLSADETDPDRAAVATYADQLRAIAAGVAADATAEYRPERIAVQAAPVDSTRAIVPPEPIDWTDPEVDLEAATDCVEVTDPATVAVLLDAGNNQTFIDDGIEYNVAARPILPGDTCRPEAPTANH